MKTPNIICSLSGHISLLSATILFYVLSSSNLYAENIKVVLRYDDYSSISNIELEKELFKRAEEIGIGVLVGVIPFPGQPYDKTVGTSLRPHVDLPPAKIALLRDYADRRTIHIAIHGHSHVNNALSGTPSEMAGLPLDLQIRLLTRARDAMNDSLHTDISTFIPPFNTFDNNTLKALQHTGFRLVSAGRAESTHKLSALNYLPGGPYPQKIRQTIKAGLSSKQSKGLLVISSHAYDFSDSGQSLPKFRVAGTKTEQGQISLKQFFLDLAWLKQQNGVEFTTIDQLLDQGEDLSQTRLDANLRWQDNFITQKKLLPSQLDIYPVAGLYYPTDTAARMYWQQIWLAALFYSTIVIAVFFAFRYYLLWIHRIRPAAYPSMMRSNAVILSIVSAIIIYKTTHGEFYLSTAIAAALCAGSIAQALLFHLRLKPTKS